MQWWNSEIDPWSLSTSVDRKENGNSNRHEVQLAVTEEKRKFNFFDWYQLSGQFDLLAPNDDSTNPKSVDDPALSLQPICLIRNELVLDYFWGHVNKQNKNLLCIWDNFCWNFRICRLKSGSDTVLW